MAKLEDIGRILSPNSRNASGNRKELTAVERAAILAGRMAGVLATQLAREFDCTTRTIQRTLIRFNNHQTVESRPRSGRPKKRPKKVTKAGQNKDLGLDGGPF